jgi:hypothetical protein
MSRVLIITSAAYAEAELQVEFGRLPPAFLPIGNRRLFVHQHRELQDGATRIILSLPDDFTPNAVDLALLAELGIEAVHVPPGLSVGQSIVYVINVTASAVGPVAILHGDTLLRGLDRTADDAVSVSTTPASYEWGNVRIEQGRVMPPAPETGTAQQDERAVLSGYFVFSDAALLVQAITRAGGNFLHGLLQYGQERPLRPLESTDWLDFGHANTYHQSRGRVTTQRAFNELRTTPRQVVKSARNTAKIVAEARWFEALPPPLRAFTPAFLGMRDTPSGPGYALEYLYLPTLSDLYVFGSLSVGAWERVFSACDEFLTACASFPAPADAVHRAGALFGEKAQQRLDDFAVASGVNPDLPCRFNGQALPSLRHMADLAARTIPPTDPARHLRLVHGDFCFSNILYDARACLVRVIDPRGIAADGTETPFGDLRYDLGKLYHSVVGRYDHILAGYYRLAGAGALDLELELPDGPAAREIEALFLRTRLGGLRPAEAASHAVCVLLFLSMLPLHADDPRRQRALLANAMRLFAGLDEARAA